MGASEGKIEATPRAAAQEPPQGQAAAGPEVSRSSPADSASEKPADPLDKAFVAKVAVYAGGLAAGLGIKALDRDLLSGQLSDDSLRSALKSKVMDRVAQSVSDADVTYGVDAEVLSGAADAFMEALVQDSDEMVSRKIAEGEAPTPGEDARLEYLLNPDSAPMHVVQDVPDTSPRTWVRMVQEGEALVQVIRAQPGQAGTSVTGEPIESPKPKEVSLEEIAGEGTTADGDRLTAQRAGACEEDARGRLRVVPEVDVEAVDSTTGSLPEAGVSSSAILVRRRVASDLSVMSSESVFIGAGKQGGTVEQSARVTAKNLAVNGTLFGNCDVSGGNPKDSNRVEVQETCIARTVERRAVSAGRILVSGDARLSNLQADAAIRIDGSMVGGDAACSQRVDVGKDLGTPEGGTRTRVMLPRPGDVSRRERGLRISLNRQQRTLAELQDKQTRSEAASQKRGQADPYWSQLLSGEYKKPENPTQARTLRQFKDLLNERKADERAVNEIGKAIRQMKEELDAQAEAASESELLVRVGGSAHLDATFEASLPVGDESALELQLTYVVDGKRYRNHTLKDLKAELMKRARSHLESETAQVDARKQAIDQMFKDAEQRPSGPEVKHKQFQVPFAWSETDEAAEHPDAEAGDAGPEESPLKVTTAAWMDSAEPDSLYIQTTATPRETLNGAVIRMKREGPRIKFEAEAGASGKVSWRQDAEAKELLSGIAVRGVTAWELVMEKKEPDKG